MRELLLILGAACIASMPFVAFSEWFQKAPHHVAATLWDTDLKQANTPYSMPKAITVHISTERK